MNANIKEILKEITLLQSDQVTEENKEKIKDLLQKADLIITECHTTKTFNVNKNEKFNRLVYEYQRLNLKFESYIINKQINNVNKEYKEIKENQETIKVETNNLVYNILGFIASFSVVSASISAVNEMKSLSDIMLFMSFCTFILLTTLIGLHNFYKSNENKKNKLQNNYFLWKMMIVVMFFIVGYKFILFFKENRNEIFESIGRGIGQFQSIQQNNTTNP